MLNGKYEVLLGIAYIILYTNMNKPPNIKTIKQSQKNNVKNLNFVLSGLFLLVKSITWVCPEVFNN